MYEFVFSLLCLSFLVKAIGLIGHVARYTPYSAYDFSSKIIAQIMQINFVDQLI